MNFQERFKGKTSLMTKNGPTDLLGQPQNPIPKLIETTKPIENQKMIGYKPLKLPLQTYNPKYPPSKESSAKQSLQTNPFLVNNPYVFSEEVENQQSNASSYHNLNNFQAHLLKGSPSMKNSNNNYKDILVSNSRNIMFESPFEKKDYEKETQNKRPPSFDNINYKMLSMNRKTNSANSGLSENDVGLKYKPYTIKEYNELQKTASSVSQKGLGPNINTEDWLKRKEKLDKMINFSQNVKLFNSKKITDNHVFEQPIVEKNFIKSKREKALDFAKNIPKPLVSVKRKPENNEIKGETKELKFNNELEILEQQHLKLLNEIEKNLNNK